MPGIRGEPTVRGEATSTFAFQVFGMAAGAITNIVIARTLGPPGKGILTLLGSGVFMATSLGALGLQAASVYLIGKGRFTKEEMAAAVTVTGLATGVLCAIATWLFLPRFQGTVPLTPLMIGATALVVMPALLRLNLSGIFLATGRMFAYNLSLAGLSVAWTIGAFVLLVPLRGGVQDAVLALVRHPDRGGAGHHCGRLPEAPPRTRGLWRCLRSSLGFGLQTYAANLIWIMVLRIDSFILAAYRSAAEVGIYSVAVLVAEVMLHLPRSLSLVLTRRFAAGALLPTAHLAARASRLGSMAVFGLGIGLAVLAQPVIPFIFGAGFTASTPPLLWLLPGIASLSIAAPLSLYLVQQRGKPVWTGGSALIALLINVGLNLLWIPRHGAVGAAWASSVAYTVHAVVIALLFRNQTGLGWAHLVLPRRDDFRTWIDLFSRRGS